MPIRNLLVRFAWKYRRTVSKFLCRRMVEIKTPTPLISFSFDDAPQTAFINGGGILKSHGVRATFFVSFGLLGSKSPSGTIAFRDDLCCAVEDGHELGCHTFDHKDSWKTKSKMFEQSIIKNRLELKKFFPETVFTTFAYPFCEPRPAIKHRVGKIFKCCRGGGQTFNFGITDLNLLKAFFLDKRIGDTLDTVKKLIDLNSDKKGWLIFVTHDVDDNPSQFGCTKQFFKNVVAYAASSGAVLLPVDKAFDKIQITNGYNI